jgi:hypothetical protein
VHCATIDWALVGHHGSGALSEDNGFCEDVRVRVPPAHPCQQVPSQVGRLVTVATFDMHGGMVNASVLL